MKSNSRRNPRESQLETRWKVNRNHVGYANRRDWEGSKGKRFLQTDKTIAVGCCRWSNPASPSSSRWEQEPGTGINWLIIPSCWVEKGRRTLGRKWESERERERKRGPSRPIESHYRGQCTRCPQWLPHLHKQSIHPSARPPARPPARPSVHPSIRPSMRLSVRPFIYQFIHPSIHASFLPSESSGGGDLKQSRTHICVHTYTQTRARISTNI